MFSGLPCTTVPRGEDWASCAPSTSTGSDRSAGSDWAPGSSARASGATATRYAGRAGARHRPPRPRAGRHALRHRRDLRLRPQRADPRRGAGGASAATVVVASKIFPVAPFPPVVRQRWAGSARRLGARPDPALPGAPAQPGRAGLGDHARDARSCSTRAGSARPASPTTPWTGGSAADAALGRPVVSNQVQFSLAHAGPLDDLVPFAERENRVVIAYSPLAQGLLGGRYGVGQPAGRGARDEPAVRDREPAPGRAAARPSLREVAAAHDAKPAQIALAWLVAPAAGRGHPRGVQRRAAGVQRRGGRDRPDRRRAGRADRRGAGVLAGVGGADPRGRRAGAVRGGAGRLGFERRGRDGAVRRRGATSGPASPSRSARRTEREGVRSARCRAYQARPTTAAPHRRPRR